MSPNITLDLSLKVLAAVVLGGMIGWQRELQHKPAGFRTHILIVLGATIAMQTSIFAGAMTGGDATRIASNIIVGIGFIGAGTIMKEGPTVYGLTTAATIWVAGALGLAVGAGYYGAAILLTFATLVVLGVFSRIESLIVRRRVLHRYQVIATDSEAVIGRIQQALDRSPFRRGGLDFRREGDRIALSFELADVPSVHETFFRDLRGMKEVVEIRST
jgi:putative Mg2+ transporter-C (MgtC) family protein